MRARWASKGIVPKHIGSAHHDLSCEGLLGGLHTELDTIRFFLSIRNSPGFGRSLRRTQIQPMKVITRRGIREGTASGMPLAKLARRQNDGLDNCKIRESHQRQFRFPFCGILMRATRTPSSVSADDGHRVLPDFSLVPLMKTPCPCP
jgi:hypothetical protein